MSGVLTGMGPRGAALALLVLGHALADFVLQSQWMVENKPSPGPLLAHGGVVLAAHAVALAPMLTPFTLGLLAAVAAAHVVVDAAKGHLRGDEGSLAWFLGDQAAHAATLLVAWALIPEAAWQASPAVEAVGGVTFQLWSWLTVGAVHVAAFAVAGHGGNAIVRGVLPDADLGGPADGAADLEAGSTIGALERWLTLVLTLAGQYAAIAIVFAAKSIARFDELKERPFAEYYLVGTLTSVLTAVGLGLAVAALV